MLPTVLVMSVLDYPCPTATRIHAVKSSTISPGFLFLTSPVQSQQTTVKHFFRETDQTLGARHLSSPSTERSLLSCVIRCLNKYPSDCHSVVYNDQTGKCTPAGWPDVVQPGPTPQKGHLYTTASCNTSDGFAIYSNNKAVACLYFPNVRHSYTTAKATCQSLSAHLLTLKSLDEISLPARLTSRMIYLGLTDQDTEGRFLWDDDGSEMTEAGKTQMFIPGQPDNFENNENCVQLRSTAFNDVDCGLLLYYVCERFVTLGN